LDTHLLSAEDTSSDVTPPTTFSLEPNDARHLAALCGQLDIHLRQIENRLGITIHNRGNTFELRGSESRCKMGAALLTSLYADITNGSQPSPDSIHLRLQDADLEMLNETETPDASIETTSLIRTKRLSVRPRGQNQRSYVAAINHHDINFGIGPAGTGKTYTAVALAVRALKNKEVKRIILTRPAVEAGENLGFLPGDMKDKLDPYMQPLYDALNDMIPAEKLKAFIEERIIQIAPLAFMRGRTLDNAFVILDEAQNTTIQQMKMFLTRLGVNSRAIITGDITQIDLRNKTESGLLQVIDLLKGIDGIGFSKMKTSDIVRHKLVRDIINAYDKSKK